MTTPYVTGTVSVTAGSAIVTGAGTGWQTAGLIAGVFGLDSANGNPIPVLSVDSDTQITLAKPWRGTNASGQAYWITYDTTPGQQTVLNAQRLAEYIARLDKPALAALASLVPAADKLPYFGAGGAGALADFSAAARALLAGGVLADGQLPSRLRAAPPGVATAMALDNVVESGWTVVAGSQVSNVNGPPGAVGGVCITLVQSTSDFRTQLYLEVGNGAFTGTWTRGRGTAGWSAWSREGFNPSRISTVAAQLSAAGSLDAVTENGWYTISAANAVAAGGPIAVAGVVIHITRDANTATQRYLAVASGATREWTRIKSGGTWLAWQLTTLPILGTVSQSSGVPTGSIIERGSNANGEYVRFADGTQICWLQDTATTPINQAIGSIFRSDQKTYTYPIAFSVAPTVSPSARYNLGNPMGAMQIGGSTTTLNIRLYGPQSTDVGIVCYMAIGRWF